MQHEVDHLQVIQAQVPRLAQRASFMFIFVLYGISGCGSERFSYSTTKNSKTFELRYAPDLGVGVNFAEDKTFSRCIHIPKTVRPSGGFEWRPYTETRIHNHQQLNEQLGVDAAISAKGIWGKGGVNARYFKNLEMSDSNFYWLVNARYELATESIDMYTPIGFGLTKDAKSILKNEGIESFYETCGTHFYMSRKLGAHMSLLYEFKSNQDRVVETLKAKGDYSGFGWKMLIQIPKMLNLISMLQKVF